MNKKLFLSSLLMYTVVDTTYATQGFDNLAPSFLTYGDAIQMGGDAAKIASDAKNANNENEKIKKMCSDFAEGKNLQSICFDLSCTSFNNYAYLRTGAILNVVNQLNNGNVDQEHLNTFQHIAKTSGWITSKNCMPAISSISRIIATCLSCKEDGYMSNDRYRSSIKGLGEGGTEYYANAYLPTSVETLEDFAKLQSAELNYIFLYNIIAKNLISMFTSIGKGEEVTFDNLMTEQSLPPEIKNFTDSKTRANEINDTREQLIKYVAILTYKYNKAKNNNKNPTKIDKTNGLTYKQMWDLINNNETAKVMIQKINKALADTNEYVIATGALEYVTYQNLVTIGMVKTNFVKMANWRHNIKILNTETGDTFEYIRQEEGYDEYKKDKGNKNKKLKYIVVSEKDDKTDKLKYLLLEERANGKCDNYTPFKDKEGKIEAPSVPTEYTYNVDRYKKCRMDGYAFQTPLASISRVFSGSGIESAIVFNDNNEKKKNKKMDTMDTRKRKIENGYDINEEEVKEKTAIVELIITPLQSLENTLIYSNVETNLFNLATELIKDKGTLKSPKNLDIYDKKNFLTEVVEEYKPKIFIDTYGKQTSLDKITTKGGYTGRKIKEGGKLYGKEIQKNTIVEYLSNIDNIQSDGDNETKKIIIKNGYGDGLRDRDVFPWGSISAYNNSIAAMQERYEYYIQYVIDSFDENDSMIAEINFTAHGREVNQNVAALLKDNNEKIIRSIVSDSEVYDELKKIKDKNELKEMENKLSESQIEALDALMKSLEGGLLTQGEPTKSGEQVDKTTDLISLF